MDSSTVRRTSGHSTWSSAIFSYMLMTARTLQLVSPWQMVFNTKKCHILSISRKRDRPTITYTLGTEKLSVVESYPYLGVTVSNDLRWHHHINTISNKATRTLNFIRRNIYGTEAKALAYTSLVRPHLEYASAVWDPYTARDSNKLDKSRDEQHALSEETIGEPHQHLNSFQN